MFISACRVWVLMSLHACKCQDNPWQPVNSFHPVGSEGVRGTQTVRHGDRCFLPLSHLSGNTATQHTIDTDCESLTVGLQMFAHLPLTGAGLNQNSFKLLLIQGEMNGVIT